MKQILVLLFVIIGMQAYAGGFPFVTFETKGGSKASFPSDGLEIFISGDVLTVKGVTYRISNLDKMYFSEVNMTSGVPENFTTEEAKDSEVYDLNGNRVSKDQMHTGIYLVRDNGSTYKIVVK